MRRKKTYQWPKRHQICLLGLFFIHPAFLLLFPLLPLVAPSPSHLQSPCSLLFCLAWWQHWHCLTILQLYPFCKEAIPPLAIPGCGCAPLGIPGAVTSVTVVTLVPFSLHSHYVSIRTIYIGPVYSCVISLITPHHHSLHVPTL